MHVRWKYRVEHSLERYGVPSTGDPHSCCLTKGMNTGVGPARAKHGDMGPAKALHRVFEHSLNRPFIGLALPACETRSFILQYKLKGSRFHCPNYRDETAAANLSYERPLTLI